MKKLLHQGIQELDLNIPETVEAKLLEYVQLLQKWNKTYNLTATKDPKEIIIRHVLDSLAVVPHIEGNRILDVGSGAGFPGIPLALALPDKEFVLLDSNSKKTRFLTFVVTALKLDNITVITGRVEQYKPQELFDCITARAVTDIEELIENTKHLITADGWWLFLKGKYPTEELHLYKKHAIVRQLKIPFLQEQRHLVCIKRDKM